MLSVIGVLCLPLVEGLCQDDHFTARPIQKIDPEYTDEARIAELEGTVVLWGVIDQEGFARDLQVEEPLGLGLDEKAVEAVKQWEFPPAVNQDPAHRVLTRIQVDFRLNSKLSRWHLVHVQFDPAPGVIRPKFASAFYPIGAGITADAMEEGRVVVAIGRMATAKLTFMVDQVGIPVGFKVVSASEPMWGNEAASVVSQWRFTPGTSNGIPIPVLCTVELMWGARDLSGSTIEQWRQTFSAH
jgi:TonB family protein